MTLPCPLLVILALDALLEHVENLDRTDVRLDHAAGGVYHNCDNAPLRSRPVSMNESNILKP